MTRNPKDYEKLIYKMAWKFLRSFKGAKEFKDLVQEGWEEFYKLEKSVQKKPLTCEFSTALCIRIKHNWCTQIQKARTIKRGRDYDFVDFNPSTDRSYDPTELMETYYDLTEEMKAFVQILLDTPVELAMLCKTLKPSEAIGKYLKNFMGWKPRRINKLKAELSPIYAKIR